MDLLRAHADAVMLGMGTLREEQRMGRPRPRGPVFRIMDAGLQQLRTQLRRGQRTQCAGDGAGRFPDERLRGF